MPAHVAAQSVATAGEKASMAYEFDSNLLARSEDGSRAVDLSRFAHGNPVLPGNYRADVYLNERWMGRHDIKFTTAENEKMPAVACLEPRWMGRLNVDPQKLSPQARAMLGRREEASTITDTPSCIPIALAVDGATSTFDPSEQRLELTVPQAYVQRNVRGYVAPELWTEGITAGTLNYMFNHQENKASAGRTSQSYLGFVAGLNVGSWRLHHQGSLSKQSGSKTLYQRVATNARRDLTEIRSTLTLGDTYTDGQLFDTFAVRGVMLASDDRMLPDSQRGFAPVIRGEARTQAKVQVRQNGMLLYETSVPPGPFLINDLYPTGAGGDIEVTVTEADGSQHGFTLPSSPMPMLLREGGLRYSLVAGTLRNLSLDSRTAMGSVQYGLNNSITLNGAALASENYVAILGGAAINSPWGAWAADYTTSRLSAPGRAVQVGGSLRASWSMTLPSQTNLSFASYRYSSEHYYNLQDANRELYGALSGRMPGTSTLRARNRVVASISQTLGSQSTIYFTGASNAYWSTLPRSTTFQVGYSRTIGRVQFSLGAARETMSGSQTPVNRLSIGVTLPLDSQPGRNTQARAYVQHDNVAGTSEQASLTGSFGEENRTGWGLYTARSREGTNSSASINYQAPLAQLGANISGGGGYSSVGFFATGGLVAHSGGITLAPYLGETIGLVKVENAQDVRILGAQAATIDSRGYTVIPHLLPYQLNNVELDFSQASLDTQVDSTNLQAAPRARAVAAFNFSVPAGRVIFIRTTLDDNSPAPFGATVFNEKGEVVGAVGQAGKAEARVTDVTGVLTIKWGEGAEQRCSLPYKVTAASEVGQSATAYQPMQVGRCATRTLLAPNQVRTEKTS